MLSHCHPGRGLSVLHLPPWHLQGWNTTKCWKHEKSDGSPLPPCRCGIQYRTAVLQVGFPGPPTRHPLLRSSSLEAKPESEDSCSRAVAERVPRRVGSPCCLPVVLNPEQFPREAYLLLFPEARTPDQGVSGAMLSEGSRGQSTPCLSPSIWHCWTHWAFLGSHKPPPISTSVITWPSLICSSSLLRTSSVLLGKTYPTPV